MLSSILMLSTFALYWPAHRFGFVDYDDPDYILREPVVRAGLSSWGLIWSVVAAHASNWHPLTWISHMLDCQLFGLNPGPPHVINALLHGCNSALLFFVLWKMTGAYLRSALVAALFAWHPLRVESVAWISERKDVLSGLFFMLTLWAYTEFVRQNQIQNSRPKRWFGASLFFFTLGLMSKPMLVTTPFVLLLLDIWPLRRLAGNERGLVQIFKSSEMRRRTAEKIPFLMLAVLCCIITFVAQKTSGAVTTFAALGLGDRIKFFLIGYVEYLGKIFWPHNLTFLYLRPATVPWMPVVFSAILLLAVTTFALAQFRSRPYLIVGWLWFLGILVPVSNLVPVGLQSIADRYTYLPAIGIALIFVWGGGELIAWIFPKPAQKNFSAAMSIVLLVVCAALTKRQLAYWQNTETLMDHALELDPNNYVAHENLVSYYSRSGEKAKEQFHYRRARELDPALTGLSSTNSTGANR